MDGEVCDCSFAVARRKINDLFGPEETARIPGPLFDLLYATCDVFAAGSLMKAVLQMNDTTTISFAVKNSVLFVERKDTEKKTEVIPV